MEKTLHITDQELHSTLNEFLEEKEKKSKQSIWNISSVTGLVLVLFSAAFAGHFIGTELLGLNAWPLINTVMGFAPYIGGVLLGLIILSTLTKSKGEKVKEEFEEEKAKEAYDKLDQFLYKDQGSRGSKRKSGSSTKSKSKSYSNFSVSAVQKLMRSRTDKKIAGVCGGLAKYLGVSSTIIRIIFVLAMFLGYGSFLLVYIAMAIIMPKEPIFEMDDFK